MKPQETPNNHSNLGKEEQSGDTTLPHVKLYFPAILIKSAEDWHKNRQVDHWSRMEIPERNPDLYGQLIFDKGSKNIQWGKYSLFKNRVWKIRPTDTCKKDEARPPSYII